MVMTPPPMCDSAVLPCFHGCPAFLCRHFPSQSPPSHPLNPSLHSQQQPLPKEGSTIPKFQLPAAELSRGPASLSPVSRAVARAVWFSFPLGCHRSVVSFLALNFFALTQAIALMWGTDPWMILYRDELENGVLDIHYIHNLTHNINNWIT